MVTFRIYGPDIAVAFCYADDRPNFFHKIQLIRSVKHGGFGQVFQAFHVGSKRPVAYKEVYVTSGYRASREKGPRVDNEAELQSTLNHENVLKLLDHWKESDKVCLVFEWMEYNLSEFLKANIIDERTKKSFMRMLLSAVAYIHGKRIFHRDINPRNMLMSKDGVLKLGDFGLARKFREKGSEAQEPFSSCAGTREYRAPEMLYGLTFTTTLLICGRLGVSAWRSTRMASRCFTRTRISVSWLR